MNRGLIVIIGYLLGSVQTAIILGKIKGVDIKKHGSGNAGTTNALRVFGFKTALVVFIFDMLKAVFAILITNILFAGTQLPALIISIYTGLGAILGHNWPIYFKFKGGKGIAVSTATLLMIDYRIGLTAMLVFIVIVFFTRYVSLGSILLTISAPIMLTLLYRGEEFFIEAVILITLIPILAIYQHRGNISRLIKGTESKLGEKK
ncbi:MAG: glycerol-3-phosphate 1-O-acyltransferase PlsY [Epulopiscium sp.]|nr:glycerol-3-phosphate 1-O-acyltransferase PlsY [Candidatus Epulonipiscium sp.]